MYRERVPRPDGKVMESNSSDPFQYCSLPSLPPRSPDDAFQQRERSGKPRPIGIAHPLKQTSDATTTSSGGIVDTSKLTLKSLPPDCKLQRSDLASSSAALTHDILSKDDSSDSSYEYTFTPKQTKPLKPPQAAGILEAQTNRKWHVFISHSTSDQQWVRETIIVPLRDPPDLKRTLACYHCMPDHTRFNDNDILAAMRDTYIILIALSTSYTYSQR